MKKIKVSDYLADFIHENTSKDVFGVVGGTIENIINSLKKNNINFINSMSENAGLMMALGYQKASSKIVTFIATAGPGSANSANGLLLASKENGKILVITTQHKQENFGKNAGQDTSPFSNDSYEMLKSSTCYSRLITNENQIKYILNEAINYINEYNSPAHISIPIDILLKEIEYDDVTKINNQDDKINNNNIILEIVEKLKKNSCIILGKRSFGFMNEINKIIDYLNIDTYTTPTGKSCVDYRNKNFKGTIGTAGNVQNDVFKAYDNIIFIGEELSDHATDGWSKNIINKKLTVLDNNKYNLLKKIDNYSIISVTNIDFKNILKNIEPKNKIKESENKIKESENIDDFYYNNNELNIPNSMTKIRKKILNNSVCFFDVGSTFLWGIHTWKNIKNNHETFFTSLESGSMTSAINMAIGYSFFNKNIPVVLFTGDGSMLMNSHELLLVKNYNLNILIFVMNDGEYGVVKHGQTLNKSFLVGNKLGKFDFSIYADFIGLDSFTIKKLEEFDKINILQIQKNKKPFLIDLKIKNNLIPPFGTRLKYLMEE